MLHINKTQEEVIPLTTLIILVLTTVPWLLHGLRKWLRPFSRLLAVILVLVVSPRAVCREQTIEVHGILDVALYDPRTGAVHPETQARSAFVATLAGRAWRVSVTNQEREFTWWTERIHDGTNTYVLKPHGGSFWHTNPPRSDLHVATVAPSPVGATLDGDPLGAALVCLTYGLSPQSFRTNEIGLVEMPLPWTIIRDNPDAFGFKWVIHASDDGRFLNDFSVFRDIALDRTNEKELLRAELDYPDTLSAYNAYMGVLLKRKGSPSGYLRAHYECTAWYPTNELIIPKAAKLEVYLPPASGRFPARSFKLEATALTIHGGAKSVLPQISTPTSVADYRYKRANQKRIFKYAEYTLKPGDSWKSANDSALLAKAEHWLKHGRKYADFADNGKRWVTWLVLVVLVAPALAIALKKAKTKPK